MGFVSKNNKVSTLIQAGLFILPASYAGSVLAVDPQPIEAGAFNLIPTVSVDIRDTDNMFLSNTDEVDSKIYIVSPRLEAVTESNGNSLRLIGQIDEANFSATDEDDYTDWRVGGEAHLQMDLRNAFDFNAGFFRTREMRGTGFSQGGLLPTTPDRYEETTFGGSYQFGTRESAGRLVLSADSYDKSYRNNRATTQFRDREDMDWSGALYFNISPRTDIFVEYIQSTIDYGTDPLAVVGAPDSLDSDEDYIFVGVSWEVTGATTGSFKIGQGDKSFDDVDRQDADVSAYEANILWEPLSYSAVSFTAKQGFDEAVGQGNALETTNYNINWQHGWSDSLTSTVNWYTSDDEYVGSSRQDDIDLLSIRLDYSVQRWFDVYVSYQQDERSSSFGNFNYKQNLMAVGFAASL